MGNHCQQLKKKAQTIAPENLLFPCRFNRFPELGDRGKILKLLTVMGNRETVIALPDSVPDYKMGYVSPSAVPRSPPRVREGGASRRVGCF